MGSCRPEEPTLSKKVQITCAWMGILFTVVLFTALIAANMLPPFAADATAEETAAWYREHTNGIRFGMILIMFGAMMTAPVIAAIASHVKQIEGEFTPLTYTILLGGAANVVAI